MITHRLAVLRLVPALMLLVTPLAAQAQEQGANGRNPRMFALPAPENLKIDGDLSDWDTSGGILSFPALPLRDQRAVTSYAMYDEQALYLAGEVVDDTPMTNRHDPKVNPEKAWDADAYQFRLYLDSTYPGTHTKFGKGREGGYEVAHMLLWHYTDRQEANLQLRYTMSYKNPKHDWPNGIAPPDKFDGAYREWEGKDGYTFEYRIPWDTLGEQFHPEAGDITAANIQVQWGRPDGLKSIAQEGWLKDLMRKPGFPFQSTDVWGKLIFAERGALPAEAGQVGGGDETVDQPTPLELRYSLPRSGEVSIGLYDQSNVLRRQIVAEAQRDKGDVIEAWDGLDHNGEPLDAGRYTWRGVVSDPITTEFILSVHNSGTPPYKTDDNTGGWGGDHGEPTTVAAAGDRMLLAWDVAESGWGIIGVDLTGDRKWGTKGAATYLATDAAGERFFHAGGRGFAKHLGVRVRDSSDSRMLSFGNGDGIAVMPEAAKSNKAAVTGIATVGDKLYISYGSVDLIAVNNASSGELMETWSVESPGRLAIAQDGSLLALSRGNLLRLTPEGEASPFASQHLDDPAGIAVDNAGRVYVTNHGELHNVSVFSPEGEYLTSIGKKGGRARMGTFEPEGMLAPGGCAIDAKGRLWVAETLDFPKRVSVWNTETGENVDQFFGGSSYFGWAWMDPERPDEIYCHNVLWKVDLDKRTKQIVSTIYRRTGPNQPHAPNPDGYTGHFRVFTADNGRQYGWGQCGGARSNMIFLREGDEFRPVAGVIPPSVRAYPALADLIADQRKQWDEQGVPGHRRPNRLFWQDLNDDSAVQADEVAVPPLGRKRGYFDWIGKDLTAWSMDGTMVEPTGFEGGRPVYDFEQLRRTPLAGLPGGAGEIWFDDRHGDGVYRLNEGEPHTLSKWTLDGQMLWSTGQRLAWRQGLSKPVMQPGDLWGMTMPLTLAGDFTGAATYFGGYHLFSRTGEYIAMIMRPHKAGGGFGPDKTASETITGQLVKPKGTGRYFLLAGDQDGRVTEIHGLDSVEHLEGGSIVLSPHDVDRVTEAQRQFQARAQSAGVLFLQRGKVSLETPHGSVKQRLDEQRAWRAQIAHDDENLYLQYHVESHSPLINQADDPRLIFKSGNLIDVQLATNPSADADREKPAPGDIRLLISRSKDGSPTAVLYRPKVEGFDGEPIVLRSPTGTEPFDRIREIDKVEIEYEQTDTGFSATVTVPLTELKWNPVAGQTIRADLGYIFGNTTGTNVSARSYWRNNGFSANVIDDVPHESRLQPHEWGLAVVE